MRHLLNAAFVGLCTQAQSQGIHASPVLHGYIRNKSCFGVPSAHTEKENKFKMFCTQAQSQGIHSAPVLHGHVRNKSCFGVQSPHTEKKDNF